MTLLLAMIFGYDIKSNGNESKSKQLIRLHQLKSFCITKEINNKIKKQPMEWENIFVNHISYKGLISKIFNEHIQLNSSNKKSNNNPIINGQIF